VPTPIVGVPLAEDEDLTNEFCLVIISKCICVSLIGIDATGPGVDERNRRFETRWSFDRAHAVEEARRLLGCFGDRVPAPLREQIANRLQDAEQAVPRRIEARLTAAFEQMVKRYQWVAGRVNDLEDERARLTPVSTKAPVERDALTGVARRRTLARFFGQLMVDAANPQVAVAWLDIDDLDAINVRHGRAAGDAALRFVADTIRAQVRDEDCLVRWGDDEFVVAMPGMDIATAKRRAMQFVESVTGKALPNPHANARVSISCGVAVGDFSALALNRLRETVNHGRSDQQAGRTAVGDI
jgi:diguanylate cyclase (GGDEF)-like protein